MSIKKRLVVHDIVRKDERMNSIKEQLHTDKIYAKDVLLAADIGGTNSRFGIFYSTEGEQLVLELFLSSAEITNFAQAVVQVIAHVKNRYQLVVRCASFAVAGAISTNGKTVKLTNVSITVDVDEIKEKTGLQKVVLINDFQAIAYGIPLLASDDFVSVRSGTESSAGTHVIIGAGTGLGKALFVVDQQGNPVRVLPSEGGHADFAVHSLFDYEFMRYCQRHSEHPLCIVTWEDAIAGRGIVALYRFLVETRDYQDNDVRKKLAHECTPETIFANRADDPACADTYSLYGQWYGRCIKNFALEALAYGGIFIAGGIAAHNSSLFFEPLFMGELTGCAVQAQLIEDIPIKVILNTQVGLYGAANYFLTHFA